MEVVHFLWFLKPFPTRNRKKNPHNFCKEIKIPMETVLMI